jgi:hypothetical protein
VPEIHSSCPLPDCVGLLVFIPLVAASGAVAECDGCGGTFQLSGGRTSLIRPPQQMSALHESPATAAAG